MSNLTPQEKIDFLAAARKVVGDRCTVEPHEGRTSDDFAVTFSGNFKDDCELLAQEVRDECGGKMVSDGGFVAVWMW